jgi:hypothetical protein
MQLNITRTIAAGCGGIASTIIEPTLPLAAICTGMVMADVVTAWSLSRRIAKQHPETAKAGVGKLQSHRLGKSIITLGKIYALLLMATAIDQNIMGGSEMQVSRFCAGAVCFWQAISVLENESSCSDAKWARIARRYLIDKARRHLPQ